MVKMPKHLTPIKDRLTKAPGKKRSKKWIVARMPEHEVYVEPFIGPYGSVYRYKQPATKSVISDLDCKLVKRVSENGPTKRECSDFEKVVKKYDSNKTLHYLDPPYQSSKCYYKYCADKAPPERVNKVMRQLKGKVMLSYEDTKEARQIFCHLPFRCGTVNYMGFLGHPKRELLVTNFRRSE